MPAKGQKNPRHLPPVLTYDQVEAIRIARAALVPFKVLARQYNCSRKTLYRATHGQGPYAAHVASSAERVQALIDDAARWRAHVAIQRESQYEAR